MKRPWSHLTYASCVSSGLRQAAQTRESRVLFHYEKRREAMEKPGEHAEQTHSLDPAYIRQHTYYQALQHHYQSVMHHPQTLMAHHESLMEHHYIVQVLYEEVLDAERGTPNQQQAWQTFHRELQNHHRMVEDHSRMLDEHRDMREQRPSLQEPE